MSGEVPEFRDLIFMTVTAHPDTDRREARPAAKVALAFGEAQRLLKTDPKRGKALLAKEYPTMTLGIERQGLRHRRARSGHSTRA